MNLKLIKRVLRTFIFRNTPIYSHLYVTKRCNLRCVMCNVWQEKSEELSTEEIFTMIDRLDKLGVAFIQITGGEPFLRKDIKEIISYVKYKGLKAFISSNGTLPEKIYSRIKDHPIDGIGISLHSTKAEIHEQINGIPGSWQKAIDTINYLKSINQDVYVCSVISSINHEETDQIVDFCENKLGVSVGLQPAVIADDDNFVFRAKNKKLLNLSETDVNTISKVAASKGSRRTSSFQKKSFKVLSNQKVNWKCRAGEMFYAVMADGQVGICQDILTDLNIFDEDFKKKIKSKEFKQKARELVKNCSGCVYSCYYDTNNMFSKPWQAYTLNRRIQKFK